MKQVYFIPMSLNEEDNEKKINEAITKIGYDNSVTWLTDLTKAFDEDKYMLVAEKEDGEGTLTPTIGVKVIKGSQDTFQTEKIINEALLKMEEDEETFISLSHPAEFMYIILFEYKAGTNPRVKILKNPADPYSGSRTYSNILQLLDDDDEWGLEPYDNFALDDNNVMFLFKK